MGIHPSAVFRELEGESVILNLDTGVYYGLDDVGTRMWKLIHEHGTVAAVCARMVQEFDVQPEVLERDVRRLIEDLVAKGLLVESAA